MRNTMNNAKRALQAHETSELLARQMAPAGTAVEDASVAALTYALATTPMYPGRVAQVGMVQDEYWAMMATMPIRYPLSGGR